MKVTLLILSLMLVIGCAGAGEIPVILEWDSPTYEADSLCNLDTSFVILAEECSCQVIEYRNVEDPPGQWALGAVLDGWYPGEHNQAVVKVPSRGWYEFRTWSILVLQDQRYPMCVSNIVLKEARSTKSAYGVVNLR